MNVHEIRKFAISQSLFTPTTLQKALDRLGFVQADPIRAPARAQDLILRQRVKNYHIGDLDKSYGRLHLDEDFLYAYGFFSSLVRPLLHPKTTKKLNTLENKILSFIEKKKKVHPRDVVAEFGNKTGPNWWGGNSNLTKMSLDQLHYHGYLRISGRTNGIRTYEMAPDIIHDLSDDERAQRLALLIIKILQPVTDVSYRQALNYIRHFILDRKKYTAKYIQDLLLKDGSIKREKVDGIFYSWIPEDEIFNTPPESVKFLAPFDPVVWDRARFEHVFGWPYRFEAYTPAAKRIRGYYSLPLLWKYQIPGWVNIKKGEKGLEFDIGYVKEEPKNKTFVIELEKEKKRFEEFMSNCGPERT